jgi:hypothetical protein
MASPKDRLEEQPRRAAGSALRSSGLILLLYRQANATRSRTYVCHKYLVYLLRSKRSEKLDGASTAD